ncbi:MAG: DNA-deoxyinosine glycosylase [Traorella sp.]
MNRVIHELEPIFDEESRILILGSFPSVKSREIHFYYGNPQNRFWKIFEQLYDVKFDSIEMKKKFLYEHHIALWDVIESCTIIKSSDASISNVKVNDIAGLLSKTKINKIYVNGKKAYEYYMKYIYDQIHYDCIVLPSTSSANASYSFENLIEKWKIVSE